MFQLNALNIKSALVYVFLAAFFQLLSYIIGVGDVWKLDYHTIVNTFVIAFAVGCLSIIKNLLTTSDGKFLGVTQVTETTK